MGTGPPWEPDGDSGPIPRGPGLVGDPGIRRYNKLLSDLIHLANDSSEDGPTQPSWASEA